MDKARRKWISAASAGAISLGALLAKKASAQQMSGGGGSSLSLGTGSSNALPGNYGGVDDPGNASGLGAPAIIRGTVYAHLAAGVTMGSGQSTPTRQATATGLQNAINYAAANGKFFEIIPGVYEINSSTGLVCSNVNGLTWRGALSGDPATSGYPGSQIIQFYNSGSGAPVLTFGDTTGGSLPAYFDVRGVDVRYGFAPTALTNANTLVFGGCALSNFDMIGVQPGGSYSGGAPAGFNGYNGVVFTGGQFFSNKFGTMTVFGGQQNIFKATNFTTGNVFDNVYLNMGGGSAHAPLAGSFVTISAGEVTFHELNCEWAACNRVLDIEGTVFSVDLLHVEGIAGTGFVPTILYLFGANGSIRVIDVVDYTVLLANMTSTAACVCQDSPTAPSTLDISQVNYIANTASQVNAPIWFMLPDGNFPNGTYGINHGCYTVRKFAVGGSFSAQYAGFLSSDPHMPVSASAYLVPQRYSNYEWAEGGSTVTGAVIPVSATYTHYGQYEDATLIVPTSVTAFTITLADTMGASPSTQAPRTGCRVHITREAGTSVGVVTVKDGGGTTLSTLAAGVTTPTDFDYAFNGTAWAVITGVPTGGGWSP